MIDTESDPGSWAEALKYSNHIKVLNHPEEDQPTPEPQEKE